MKLTRTEKWKLLPSSENKQDIKTTVALYQRYVRALSSVCLTHWKELGSLSSKDAMTLVEHLIHPTKQRPKVKYKYFTKTFYKFPSYLRRSAIHDAIGQVQSFLNRYDQWQTNASRKTKHAKPPVFGISNTYPSLYKGQCIKYADDLRSAQIKVYKDNDWKWIDVTIKKTGKRTDDVTQKRVSPQLVANGKHVFLAVPYEQNVKLFKQKADIVCAVDLGINTQITASIVQHDGTVLARRFIANARDIDRLHKRLDLVKKAASKTKKLCQGFASAWYRKGLNIAKNSAHHMTRELVEFARANGATTIVFENLKGWRPKAPRYGLRKKFHTWLHRRVVEFTESKWREYGGRLATVSARNTSKFAYDGSGQVTRSVNGNYSVCRFKTGKVYNCDLNATYNIAAKYFLRSREADQAKSGKSPDLASRIPITLSMLWDINTSSIA
jgi:IS605 OrfB family transposase